MAQAETQEVEGRLGMTEAQWAQWQAYTHGYGEQDENGIDISLIRENLRLSPWKRLRKLQRNSTFFKKDRMDVTQVDDFQQIIAVLTAASLRFVIVGGIAMRLQGSAHITDDIDFVIARDTDEVLWNNATVLDRDGLAVRVASVPDLIAMKRAAGRPKDKLHLMELEQMQKQISAS